MIERIWGRHGAILPRTRLVIKWVFRAVLAVASVTAPLIGWALM